MFCHFDGKIKSLNHKKEHFSNKEPFFQLKGSVVLHCHFFELVLSVKLIKRLESIVQLTDALNHLEPFSRPKTVTRYFIEHQEPGMK